MTKRRNPLGRIRLVYQRSSTIVKCVVITAIVLCSLGLMILRGELMRANADYEASRHIAAQLEKKNQELETYISQLGTVEGVKHIARTELGLVPPDTIFFVPTDSTGK